MTIKGFQFELQPLLDLVLDQKDGCQEALRRAERAERARARLLRIVDRRVLAGTQQAQDAMENLLRCRDPAELSSWSAYLNRTRSELEVLEGIRAAHAEELRWAAERVQLRQRELEEAQDQVRMYERLRERKLQEHYQERERRDETERDDASIQGWNNRG